MGSTALWQRGEDGWRLLDTSGFPDEATLHDLVEEAPHVLPLSGQPALVILGREVALGSGQVDLLAADLTGQPVIIEIKLAKNAEARRAVVAQVLAYAAALDGMTPASLDTLLAPHLVKRQLPSNVVDAILASDQSGSADATAVRTELAASLAEGRFRLVLVLDSAPVELVRLAGYLERQAASLTIDLVTVASFDVGGTQVVVPQRIDPERAAELVVPAVTAPANGAQAYQTPGAEGFAASIAQAAPEHQTELQRLLDWALDLERGGLARLKTTHGVANRWALIVAPVGDEAGLVTIWNDHGASLSVWRSVFLRRAPSALSALEQIIKVGNGNAIHEPSVAVLSALRAAYEEASTGKINLPNGAGG